MFFKFDKLSNQFTTVKLNAKKRKYISSDEEDVELFSDSEVSELVADSEATDDFEHKIKTDRPVTIKPRNPVYITKEVVSGLTN